MNNRIWNPRTTIFKGNVNETNQSFNDIAKRVSVKSPTKRFKFQILNQMATRKLTYRTIYTRTNKR